MRFALALAIAALLTACAEQSAMRLSNDTVRINVSTAPIYGTLEPERRAMLLAASETIKNGYDKFLIMDGKSEFHQNVIGYTPGYITATNRSLSAVGPSTVAAPRFETAVVIKMFKANDPAGSNAVDAHEILKAAPKQ